MAVGYLRGVRSRGRTTRGEGAQIVEFPTALSGALVAGPERGAEGTGRVTWFRNDDSLYAHPKVLGMPARYRLAAMGLWDLGGTWCAHYLTAGMIPREVVLRTLGGTEKLAEVLVEAGLWEPVEDGWRYHDWQDFQEPVEVVKKRRADAAERMRAMRARRRSGARPEPVRTPSGGFSEDEIKSRASDRTAARTGTVTRNTGVTFALPDPTRPDLVTTTGTYAGNGGNAAGLDEAPTRVEQLLTEYREASPRGVPSKVAERLAGEIHQLCRDGFSDDQIREGLGQLRIRRLGPGTLPSLVDELANRPADVIALPSRSQKPTTDDKIRATLAIGERLDREARIAALNASARPAIEGTAT